MDTSFITAIASIAVATVAAASAYASQRAAAGASTKNTTTTTRTDMEKEAYERARAFDTETIRRQDESIAELRTENQGLHTEVNTLREENGGLKTAMSGLKDENIELRRQVRACIIRIARLEQGPDFDLETIRNMKEVSGRDEGQEERRAGRRWYDIDIDLDAGPELDDGPEQPVL